jgi:hypothetical protein
MFAKKKKSETNNILGLAKSDLTYILRMPKAHFGSAHFNRFVNDCMPM